MDHIGGMIPYARAKALSFGSGSYYVPEVVLEPIKAAKAAYEAMSNEKIEMDLIPMSPGDPPVWLNNRIAVFAFPTLHRVASQGYGVIVKYQGKLKEEFRAVEANKLAELRKAGVDLREPAREECEIVYTGDTIFSALLVPQVSFVFTAEVLIMECTYLDDKQEKALKYSHVHVQDLVDSAAKFKNKQVILVHISRKYKMDFIIQALRSTLPEALHPIIGVNLKLQGGGTHVTRLTDAGHQRNLREKPGWGWGGGGGGGGTGGRRGGRDGGRHGDRSDRQGLRSGRGQKRSASGQGQDSSRRTVFMDIP